MGGGNFIDSGYWDIINQNILLVKENNKHLLFDVVSYRQFYYFISPAERSNFIEDLLKAKKAFRKILRKRGEDTFSFFINSRLRQKYYTRQIYNPGA